MLLSIAPDDDVPIYLQLRDQIVAALVRGELSEGDALPSVRQLAVDLGINLHTVAKAYKTLEHEGYLRILGRRGARVQARPDYNDDYLRQLSAAIGKLYLDARGHGVDAELFGGVVDEILSKEA
ncbi:MAG: GntR family transcriptional regulator [Propionibacteriaceae bacterium]|jgi:DNA-binding transcriptional regulator YhcF (GntR family)|nr:GntR family transcriptional regulator [Propionibacteriaceae bacterium]